MRHESFGERLKWLCEKKEISQKDLAAKLEVTPATVNKWIKNTRFPNKPQTLIDLSNIFNCSVDFLLCKTNIKEASVAYSNVEGNRYKLEFSSKGKTDSEIQEIKDFIKTNESIINKLKAELEDIF